MIRDSIVRLIGDFEAEIEDLRSRHVARPQRAIDAQKAEIKRLEQIVASKDKELVEVFILFNHQLQGRIRELEFAVLFENRLPNRNFDNNSFPQII